MKTKKQISLKDIEEIKDELYPIFDLKGYSNIELNYNLFNIGDVWLIMDTNHMSEYSKGVLKELIKVLKDHDFHISNENLWVKLVEGKVKQNEE